MSGAALIKADGSLVEPIARKYSSSVQDGLEISGYFNENLDKSRRNFSTWKRNFIRRGTPSLVNYGTGVNNAVRFTGLTNFLDTYMQETAAMTIVMVAATPDGGLTGNNLPAFFGTSAGRPAQQNTPTTTFGTRGYISSPGAVRLTAGHGTSVSDHLQSSIAVLADHTVMQMFLFEIFDGGGLDKITNVTTGASTTWAGPAQARFTTVNRMRIGSIFQANVGRADMMLFQVWRKNLTAGEKTFVFDEDREYCWGRGVAV